MTNAKNLSQNEVAGFLLGLGLGLVVGLLFHPEPAVGRRGLLQNDSTKTGRSAARSPQTYSGVTKLGSQASKAMAS